MVAGLWAFWGQPAPYFDSAKRLRKLTKGAWTGYAANVTDITPVDQERH
jgi:hypothetical protein